jgi:hypothetical protein
MINEAENNRSSTTSSQPSRIGQAAKLRIDDTRACAYDQDAEAFLMEEYTCGNCIQPHKAGMDLVPPTEHYYEEVAENESLPSDGFDQRLLRVLHGRIWRDCIRSAPQLCRLCDCKPTDTPGSEADT